MRHNGGGIDRRSGVAQWTTEECEVVKTLGEKLSTYSGTNKLSICPMRKYMLESMNSYN